MNIFAVDENPIEAAKALMDRHVVKMPLETAQLLCTVARLKGLEAPYRATHANHPATKWVRASSANWNWLVMHGLALCEEYTRRYGKIHRCQSIIDDLGKRTLEIFGDNLPYSAHTKFTQCMPDKYKKLDAVAAYRVLYRNGKIHLAAWKNKQPPEWWEAAELVQ